jgi:hypothetical protein
MLLELAVAAALAPAHTLADAKPLRTVVYKVSYSRREELTIQHYGGGSAGASNPGGQVTNTGDTGTITIDVYNVVNNVVVAVVTEHWNSKSSPGVYKGGITADGSLVGYPPEISACTRALLPLFGAQFSAGTDLSQVGAQWSVNTSPPDYVITTKWLVKNVNGALVTLSETQRAKAKTPNAMDTVITGSVDYKPHVLVPLVGNLLERATRTDAGSTDDIDTNLHFERTSDTFDQSKTS